MASSEVTVALIHIGDGHDLDDSPEYRIGDFTKSLFGSLTGHDTCVKPWVKVRFQGQDASVNTEVIEASDKGRTTFAETLILQVPEGEDLQLVFEVMHDAGSQNVLRGSPQIGQAVIKFDEAKFGQVQQAILDRDGKQRGSLDVKVHITQRRLREVVLAKNAVLPGMILKKHFATHWGVGLRSVDGGADVFEMVATGNDAQEFAIVGPRGIVTHTVPSRIWDEWKDIVVRNREAQGFLPKDCLKKDVSIPTEEFKSLIVSRPLGAYDSLQQVVGTTFQLPKRSTSS